MRDGPETIFNLVLGALFLAAEEDCGTSLGEEKAPENGWCVISHRTPCINFSLIQKRKLFLGGYAGTWGLSHLALVTNHDPDKGRKAFFHLFLEQSGSDSVTTNGVIQHPTAILGIWLLRKHMETQPWQKSVFSCRKQWSRGRCYPQVAQKTRCQ